MITKPQTVKPNEPKEIQCNKCSRIVATEQFQRHEQIHIIAQTFTSNELLANISATLTEIKDDLELIKRAKAYELARQRAR